MDRVCLNDDGKIPSERDLTRFVMHKHGAGSNIIQSGLIICIDIIIIIILLLLLFK